MVVWAFKESHSAARDIWYLKNNLYGREFWRWKWTWFRLEFRPLKEIWFPTAILAPAPPRDLNQRSFYLEKQLYCKTWPLKDVEKKSGTGYYSSNKKLIEIIHPSLLNMTVICYRVTTNHTGQTTTCNITRNRTSLSHRRDVADLSLNRILFLGAVLYNISTY